MRHILGFPLTVINMLLPGFQVLQEIEGKREEKKKRQG